MKNICLIPARGGSQRIPRKNVRRFHGRPMITYSIAAARAANVFDSIVVTTDDPEIADIARNAGAEVPFLRPAELADNRALPIWALLHALETLAARGRTFDNMCLLYATAPFVRPADLREGASILESAPEVPCVLAVTDFGFPILRALKIAPNGSLEMFWPEYETTRSNDLPVGYHDAGQFLWIRTPVVLREKRLYVPGMQPLVLPRYRVQDIDTEEDWARAEKLYALLEGAAER
ncbi:N-Acetylneuraminate cytidylyltransferase [Labilithrix luteola]|uniref:N-Acetylneuraminate cytidylyltransferase n=2 Tax=Labilithrix luteola TaxID=1391654 RepID=A0A0K1Q660_9BACT|nr:N-Acetylneuraminate cytidylyltransferase [Labilithrix luteola]